MPPGDGHEVPARLPPRAWIGLSAALLLCAYACATIPLHRTGALAIAAWLLGIATFLVAFAPVPRLRRPSSDLVLGLALAFVPVVVRILCTEHYRVHGDELITAFHAATDDFSPRRFFDGVPQSADWVCQFPSPWFVLQRGWFNVFGSTIEQVRASQVPWVALTSAALFFAVRRMAGRATAVVSVFLYAFLAISLYIETTGLMFLSGTALFTAFFLVALRQLQDGGLWNASLSGVVLGLCYLFYPSAFIALPVFAAFWAVHLWRTRRAAWGRWILVPAAGFLATVGPFGVYAVTVHNYFTERSGQVSFINHHTVDYDAMPLVRRVPAILLESLDHAVRSFWTPGLGGAGGYWFGERPFFEPVSFVFFVAGLAGAVWLAKRRAEIGLALFAFLLAFLTGVVMTVPPVGYHRLSVVYPLISFLLAIPFRVFELLPVRPPVLKAGILAIAVAILASRNFAYFSQIAATEFVPEDLFVGDWINTRYPDRQLYVAAFPGHAYRKLAYFAPTRRIASTISDYHADLLQRFRTDEKYIYLITFPTEFRERFSKMDPDGRYIVPHSQNWAVFVNK